MPRAFYFGSGSGSGPVPGGATATDWAQESKMAGAEPGHRMSRRSMTYAPNGLKLFVPRRICPRKLDSWPPAGVVRLMKSKTWPSCRP